MKIPKIKEVPVPDINHPDPKFEMLPRHEFTIGLIAPKGSGKTTTIINLLEMYKGYFHNVIVFSPTVASDEKWDYIKAQPGILRQNVELQDWVEKLLRKRKHSRLVEGPPIKNEFEGLYDEFQPDFDGVIPEENFLEEYSEGVLETIYTKQMDLVKLLKKFGKTKHLANRLLIVFDDLVGSSLFSNARGNIFKGFNTRHRHYSTSMLMVAQAVSFIQNNYMIHNV